MGERLRKLREAKDLSQGDIEKRTGLLRVYTSRVENGHIVPSIETLEKYARALEMPMYALFYEGRAKPKAPSLAPETTERDRGSRKTAKDFRLFVRLLARMKEGDRGASDGDGSTDGGSQPQSVNRGRAANQSGDLGFPP